LILPSGERTIFFVGIGTRGGGIVKAAALLLVGAAGGGAAIAVASVPDSNGVIHACYAVNPGSTLPSTAGPNLRIIDPNAGPGQACSTATPAGAIGAIERPLDWNQTGPTGPQGLPGMPGTPGKTQTVVGGQTLTLSGGQVIKIGSLPTNTINVPAPPSRPSGNTVTLSIGGTTDSILGFSFVNGAARGTGAGAGSLKEFQITRQVDKASPKLALACANGTHFKQATITLRKAGSKPQTYLKYTLTNVIISAYQTGGSGHNVTPTESLSLNFTKIQISYVK
jgi:type VI protein secretion system component Hcp